MSKPSQRVRAKARKIIKDGRVAITHMDTKHNVAYGTVYGLRTMYSIHYNYRHKTFRCSCTWGQHSLPFSQHLCSHALAVKWIAGF